MTITRDPIPRQFAVSPCIAGYQVVDDSTGRPLTDALSHVAAMREADALNRGGTHAMLAEADAVLFA